MRHTSFVAVAGMLVTAGFRLLAQAPVQPNISPFPTPDGPRLYADNCSQCHGDAGDNVSNVDLMHGRFRRATTDADLVGIILHGLPGTDMPPHNFYEAEAAAIVQYLRSSADRSMAVKGDLAHGEALFTGKGNCASCHRINGAGSRVGPDLSDVGRLRHADEIQRSILEPDAEIIPANRFVRVVTKDGKTFTGRLMNHDTFTVQMIDSSENLVSQQMANVKELAFLDKSPMPSYKGKFTEQEMTDLVSYLVMQKGGAQ